MPEAPCSWFPSSPFMATREKGSGPRLMPRPHPDQAKQLYEYFVECIRAAGLTCETGRFQEDMQVELVNNGPVTILLDSSKAF